MRFFCIALLTFSLFADVTPALLTGLLGSLLGIKPATKPPVTTTPVEMLPPSPGGEYVLVMADVVHRHNNRTLETTWANDPYRKAKFWPEGTDKLTDAGREKAFEFGRFLQKIYAPDQINMHSTDTSRTIGSTQYVMAGLLSPNTIQSWKDASAWTDVLDINITPWDDDYELAQMMACKKFDQLRSVYVNSAEMQAKIRAESELCAYLEKNSGGSLARKIDDFFKWYDSMNIENMLRLHLEDWVIYVLNRWNRTLEKLVAYSFQSYVRDSAAQKARTGFLINRILKGFVDASLSNSNSKVVLNTRCAHQGTLTNILCALKVFKYTVPSFGSCISFELYKRNTVFGLEYYVQIWHRTDNSEYDTPFYLPGCGQICELKTFMNLNSDILPGPTETFDSLCQN